MRDLTDKEVLNLFREFVIQNATQWELGSNHHHPIWAVVSEKLKESPRVSSGPAWKFIQARNDKTLDDIITELSQTKNCPYCKGKGVVWKGGQFGDYETCECKEINL